jgi:hypothetical protein
VAGAAGHGGVAQVALKPRARGRSPLVYRSSGLTGGTPPAANSLVVLGLLGVLSGRVNAVLALGATDRVLPESNAHLPKAKISCPISWERFFLLALRFGYSVLFNQLLIDWRRAAAWCSVTTR